MRHKDHNCDEFILNKMYPSDINYRDKRLTKMLGIYNEEKGKAPASSNLESA